MRIDNCRIEIDGPEPPGLDGSALEFVHAIQESGAVLLHARREIWTVAQRLVISEGGATITMDPCTAEEAVGLKISYMLDYGPRGPLARQTFTTEVTPETFARELAPCRTFLLAEEVAGLKAQGIGVHLKPADVLVFDHAGPLDNRLRFANEPARHKLLDLIGDLSLCGFDLAGRIVAYRSGHALNARLALRLADLARPGRLTTRTVPAVWRRAA
jgi:UDP-3-O-acyl-N-acetylglucosamine deacetylase